MLLCLKCRAAQGTLAPPTEGWPKKADESATRSRKPTGDNPMEHTQPMRLVDLTATEPEDASPKLKQRRALLNAAGLAAFAASATGSVFAQTMDRYDPNAPPVRYPEPDVIGLDRASSTSSATRRSCACTAARCGPKARRGTASGRYLVWSDIPNDECLRWLRGRRPRRPRASAIPSGNSNGNTFDFQGRQIAFCHGTRRVIRYENDGSVTVLADSAGRQGAQRAQRRRGASRRLAVLHRPRLRQPDGVRRQPPAGERDQPAADPEGGDLPRRRAGQGGEGGRRAVQAQRAVLLARLQEVLRRRHRRLALPECQERDLGLRRRRQAAAQRQGLRRA